jgi:hypothetical protein
MHITRIEVHDICPPYHDFNTVQLARYHGSRIQRREPELPGSTDNMRYHERLHRLSVPGRPLSYANPIKTDFWDGEDAPETFEVLWRNTEDGPVWNQDEG